MKITLKAKHLQNKGEMRKLNAKRADTGDFLENFHHGDQSECGSVRCALS